MYSACIALLTEGTSAVGISYLSGHLVSTYRAPPDQDT